MNGFAVVVGTAVSAWAVIAGPAALISNEGPTVTVPAALVCLVPNLLALAVAGLVRGRSQLTQTGVLLGSFLVRPLVALGLGVAAYYGYPPLQGRGVSLLVWGAVFYLILLGAESYVVSRQVANASR
ncbi:MAG TPA: hypothetical protein VM597_09135 [Gemmataceae bacterium]|nr:hypothetical protein [Gemmataceae bacterium]